MLFGPHFMSHLTAVHNSFIFYVHLCGWHDCWRNAISIRIRVKLSPQWHDCL